MIDIDMLSTDRNSYINHTHEYLKDILIHQNQAKQRRYRTVIAGPRNLPQREDSTFPARDSLHECMPLSTPYFILWE